MIPPANQEPIHEKVSGIIERVTFHNAENGWSVIKVSPFDLPSKLVTVVIHQAQVIAGDTMDFFGAWISHPKFGRQFKAEKAISKKPASAHALEKYLGSGLIYGVGPKTAQKIVKYFGKDTLSVFDGDIERLMEVPSIGRSKLIQIKEAWEEHKAIKDVMIFLQSHGISTLYSVKIFKHYGNDAIAIVSQNPYTLAKDIYGIGFFSADRIARSLGFAEDSPERISAGIKHVLDNSRENGHCYLTKEQMYNGVLELLTLNNALLIDDPLQNLIENKDISTRTMENEDIFYYANSLYWDEINLSRRIKEILKTKHKVDKERVKQWVSGYCEKIGMQLSEEQFDTVVNISGESFSIITGGPGCGKTTTTKVIVKLFEAMKKNILLAAPTGRASQRMTEVIGRDAITIHRLLVYNPREGKFDKNENNPLTVEVKNSGARLNVPVDVLIIDETSMLDISLASSLFKAIPVSCQVIFIGDADQLPSVGAGNVLHDLLSCEYINHFSLTKIFRQAQESYIITHAHEINSGKVPQIATPVKDNKLFKSKIDCLFIDSEEASQEQLKFIKRAKMAIQDVEAGGTVKVFMKEDVKNVIEKSEDGELNIYQTVRDIEVPYEDFVIPRKLFNADLQRLAASQNGAEELSSVIRQIPRYSTLHYGMTALQSVVRLVSETLPKFYGNEEIQVLAPMVRGSIGTVNLNKEIQNKVNPFKEGKGQILIGDRTIRAGDRVIQSVNNYDLGVFNGDIGNIIAIDSVNYACVVEYGQGEMRKTVTYEKSDLNELALAYAITIHKSQGSEFPIVVIPILTQHFNMLFRNLIYTGLTRARKLAVFVGSRKALAIAVQKLDTKERQTTLAYLLDSML
jgi:exodeoxyribonuclease V alpha subunit